MQHDVQKVDCVIVACVYLHLCGWSYVNFEHVDVGKKERLESDTNIPYFMVNIKNFNKKKNAWVSKSENACNKENK